MVVRGIKSNYHHGKDEFIEREEKLKHAFYDCLNHFQN